MTSDATTVASDHSALAVQGRQTAGGHRGGRADMEGQGATMVIAVVPDEKVLEDEKMALWFIVTTTKSRVI